MNLPSQNFPPPMDVPEEMREKALKRSAETLRKLDEIRRTLELPPEQLSIVIGTYGLAVHELKAEAQREDVERRTKRIPLRVRSEQHGRDLKIWPRQTCEWADRPHALWFRPEDIAIHGDRARWLVHDIKVGNKSQIHGKRAPIPGTEFGPGGVMEHLRLDVAQTGMDIALVVEYVGPEPEGEVFEATIVGTALEY